MKPLFNLENFGIIKPVTMTKTELWFVVERLNHGHFEIVKDCGHVTNHCSYLVSIHGELYKVESWHNKVSSIERHKDG